MKKSILVCMLGMIGLVANAQDEEKVIQKVIINFAAAADKNDTTALNMYLDDNYRIVMNRLFGSKEVSVVNKSDYLSKIQSKEWGGDKREVTILQVSIYGNTAIAHVKLKGQKVTFISVLVLIKDEEGKWKLVSDCPSIE